MKAFGILIISAILLIPLFSLKADDKYGSVFGRVTETQTSNPIEGISVTIVGTKLGAKTRSDGRFEIKNVPQGKYQIRFSGVGYAAYVVSDAVVNAVKPLEIETELTPVVITSKTATVKASYFSKLSGSKPSTQSLSSEEIRRLPGVQEDVIRGTALLPGVGTAMPGRNDLTVRGGAPYENLFVVDNIELPNINHFGSQGTGGGPLALINADYVRDVTFSAGAYGVRYGDKASSVMNISLRNGNSERTTGKAVLSATGFGVTAEGPLGNGSTFLAGVRRSYLDFVFKAAGLSFIPQYWDFTSKLNFILDERNVLTFLTVGALDNVSIDNSTGDKRYDNSKVAIPDQKRYFSGLTWRHLLGNGFLTVTLGESFSLFNTFQKDSTGIEIFKNDSKEAETYLKSELDFRPAPGTEVTVGTGLSYASKLKYDIIIPGFVRTDSYGVPHSLTADTSFGEIKNYTYAELSQNLESFKFTVGLRGDYFEYTGTKYFVSPFMSVKYSLNELSAFTISAGRNYQSPSYIWLIGGSSANPAPIKADQAVLGWEHTPLEDVKVQVEVYYKKYSDYPARIYRPQSVLSPSGFDDVTYDIPFGLEPISYTGSGFARGIELFVQKKPGDIPVYGLLSISVSEAKFKSLDGVERYGRYDQPFIMNLAVGWRPDRSWELSAKFRAASGMPGTPFTADGKLDYTKYNSERADFYHSADFRVDKTWNTSGFALTTYIDIQNFYGTRYKSSAKWDERTGAVKYSQSIGVLPSIGITAEF